MARCSQQTKMVRKFCFFIFAFIFNLHYYVPSSLASPIVGGIEDTDFEIKYHVSLHRKPSIAEHYEFIGGGTIIHERYVLSAAHCFTKGTPPRDLTQFDFNLRERPAKIIAGTKFRQGPGIDMDVVRVFIPEAYHNPPQSDGDLAIVKLRYDLGVAQHPELMQIKPVSEEHDPPENSEASFCGFGWYRGYYSNFQLFHITPQFSKINRCLSVTMLGTQLTTDTYLPDYSHLYATAPPRRELVSACPGDTGAGLIQNDHIIGILAGRYMACLGDYAPLKFTKISKYKVFIDRVMNKQEDRSNMYVYEDSRYNDSPPPRDSEKPSSSRRMFPFPNFFQRKKNNEGHH